MSRIGAEADPRLTEELLLNLPETLIVANGGLKAEPINIGELIGLTFSFLTPEQQRKALDTLEELCRYKQGLSAVDLAVLLNGDLAVVVSQTLPDVFERTAFWQEFLRDKKKYQLPKPPQT